MKTFEKGNITELQVQLALVKLGYVVYTPVNDAASVDLVVKIDDEYKAIQIKSSRKTSTGFILNLYSTAGGIGKKKYSAKDIDFFATFFDGRTYLIPIKHVETMNTVVLRFNQEYKNGNKAFYAVDYELK